MNRLLLIALQGMLSLCLMASTVQAQGKGGGSTNANNGSNGNNGNGGGNGNGNANGKSKPSIDNRPTEIPRDKSLDPDADPDQKGQPDKPNRPDKTNPSSDVQDLIKNFQNERENYLKNAVALKRLQKDATAEERAAIREQMKDSLERLKEQQKALRQEQRDRAKDMKNELSPDLGRVVDGAQNEGRGR